MIYEIQQNSFPTGSAICKLTNIAPKISAKNMAATHILPARKHRTQCMRCTLRYCRTTKYILPTLFHYPRLALAGCAGTEAAARGKSASVSVVCRDGFSGARAEIARAERKLVKGGAEFRNPVSVCCIMARTLLEKRLMEPLGEGAETSIAADLGAGGAFRVRISCGGEVFDFEGTENTPEGGDTPKLEGAVKISRNGKSEIRKFYFVVRRDGIAVGDHWIDAGAGK